jgi:hypothetical protein
MTLLKIREETMTHSDEALQIYKQARHKYSEQAIGHAKQTIIKGAEFGRPIISIKMSEYKEHVQTVADYLREELYQIKVHDDLIIVTIDPKATQNIEKLNLKVKIKTEHLGGFIATNAILSFVAYLCLYLIVGSGVWGTGEKSPNWPQWYQLSLWYIPAIFTTLCTLCVYYIGMSKAKLIAINNSGVLNCTLQSGDTGCEEFNSLFK